MEASDAQFIDREVLYMEICVTLKAQLYFQTFRPGL